MGLLGILVIIIFQLVTGYVCTYLIAKLKGKDFKEYLGQYGYAIGYISFIIIGLTIALIRTLMN